MKTFQGTITSLKNTKTATVSVTSSHMHPLYKKFVRSSKKFACHYEDIKLELGDEVVIEETRPLSKTKHFRVISKVEETK